MQSDSEVNISLREQRTGRNVKSDGLLAPYRVIDLTDQNGILAGKILADFLASCITNDGSFMPVVRPFPAEGHHLVNAGGAEFYAFNTEFQGLEEGQIDGREWAHQNWGTKWGDCNTERLDELVLGLRLYVELVLRALFHSPNPLMDWFGSREWNGSELGF